MSIVKERYQCCCFLKFGSFALEALLVAKMYMGEFWERLWGLGAIGSVLGVFVKVILGAFIGAIMGAILGSFLERLWE
jgi:hypothetical protein